MRSHGLFAECRAQWVAELLALQLERVPAVWAPALGFVLWPQAARLCLPLSAFVPSSVGAFVPRPRKNRALCRLPPQMPVSQIGEEPGAGRPHAAPLSCPPGLPGPPEGLWTWLR